jgi:ribosomal protein S18 acetylase RimI-like enzyme
MKSPACGTVDTVVFEVLDQRFAIDAADCLAICYEDEPVCKHFGQPLEIWQKFCSSRATYFASQGLSVVAIRGEEVVGCAWAVDLTKTDVLEEDVAPPLSHLLDCIKIVEDMHDDKGDLKEGEVCDICMVGVLPECRNLKISEKLVQFAIELLTSKGFKRCVVETTGHYSYKTALQNGFVVQAEFEYKDYQDEHGNNVLASVPEPHTKVRLLTLDL